MPLGWIDYSKNERNKVLSVIELLSEEGILDELGIAPVRDGFADRFFPGTSTIQTRAKYFLIVPYLLKDLERSPETNPNSLLRMLDDSEKECAKRLWAREKENQSAGVIGSRSLQNQGWVKRGPSSIYWTGLRSYGIFQGGKLSLYEYFKAISDIKKSKANLKMLAKKDESMTGEDAGADDSDAGSVFHKHFWAVPAYPQNWQDQLSLRLTEQEGTFLKEKIIRSHPDSMLAYILKENRTDILEYKSFKDLEDMARGFPESIRNDYQLAREFSDFLYVLYVLYNSIITKGESARAQREWESVRDRLLQIAQVDLESIVKTLSLHRYSNLFIFLRKAREAMGKGDIDELQKQIKKREKDLKQSRAKTLHVGEFPSDKWYAGGYLDYRLHNAQTIIRDIFESGGQYDQSEQ